METSRMTETNPAKVRPLLLGAEKVTHWRLFLLGFTLTALAGLSFTWLRPPLYESTALLRVDARPAGDADVPEAFVLEQLVIHRQRLGGRQLLREVSAGLQLPGIGPSRLEEMLNARILDHSRLLELSARGPDPTRLAPILNHWIERYQTGYVGERNRDSSAARQLLQDQLNGLEERVMAQRETVEAFRREHRIISLERDENRALAKVKALGASLDRASETRTQAQARVDALRRSLQRGENLVRPQDQRALDQLEQRTVELEETLGKYRQQFTEAYMAMDPRVQGIRRTLALLREKAVQLRQESQQNYRVQAERELSSAIEHERRLQDELAGFEQQVQDFSAKLQTFAAMTGELTALQAQAQQLRDRGVIQDVEATHRPTIELLEPPFLPYAPYAPDYWRDTAISLAAALAAGLLLLAFYRAINPRESSPKILITEMPSREPEKLVGAEFASLQQDMPPDLAEGSCRALVDTAKAPAALALRLLLSGVQPQRLAGLRGAVFDPSRCELGGGAGVPLPLSEPTRRLAAKLVVGADSLVWQDSRGRALGGEGIDDLLREAAYDAGLAEAALLDRRRVFATYLGFIARQGVDPAILVSHLGPLDADWLALYRRLLRNCDKDAALGTPAWRHPAAD